MNLIAHRLWCDEEEFREALEKGRELGITRRAYYAGSSLAHFEEGRAKASITFREKGVLTQYLFRLDAEDPTELITGREAYRILKRYVPDLPDLTKVDFYKTYYYKRISEIGTTAAILGYNEKHSGTRKDNVYGYDLNSAWPYFMCQPMPDTSKIPDTERKVQKGEIGFTSYIDGWELVHEGGYAQFIFPVIESPFKEFVEHWYEIKKHPSSQEEKLKAKCVLNYSIGYLQNINPFIRATVICRANEYIESLIYEGTGKNKRLKDNVLQWNTDSIISTCELPELKIGEGLGEWKLQHVGNFAYRGFAYQWNYEVPTQRGVSKGWFKERYPNGYDVLTDRLPCSDDNVYYITDDFRLEVKHEK